MTPRQLFDWACTNIQAANFGYCSNEDYQREEQNLEKRFQNSRTIPGTRKLHSFVPVSNTKVKVRNYSASKTVKEERVSSAKNDIPPNSIVGFVTCLCDGHWWLACVLEVNQEDNLVRLIFLHPHGPNTSFKYPQKEDIRTVKIETILRLVDPRTRTGRTYTLLKKILSLLLKCVLFCLSRVSYFCTSVLWPIFSSNSVSVCNSVLR